MTAELHAGDRALIRAQPLLPPVLITAILAAPLGKTRICYRHEAPGFGRSPQSTDDPRELIALPAEYVMPPTGWPAPGYYDAACLWLDEHRSWLIPVFGAARITVVRAVMAKRLGPDLERDAVLRERDRIIDGIRRRTAANRRHAA